MIFFLSAQVWPYDTRNYFFSSIMTAELSTTAKMNYAPCVFPDSLLWFALCRCACVDFFFFCVFILEFILSVFMNLIFKRENTCVSKKEKTKRASCMFPCFLTEVKFVYACALVCVYLLPMKGKTLLHFVLNTRVLFNNWRIYITFSFHFSDNGQLYATQRNTGCVQKKMENNNVFVCINGQFCG